MLGLFHPLNPAVSKVSSPVNQFQTLSEIRSILWSFFAVLRCIFVITRTSFHGDTVWNVLYVYLCSNTDILSFVMCHKVGFETRARSPGFVDAFTCSQAHFLIQHLDKMCKGLKIQADISTLGHFWGIKQLSHSRYDVLLYHFLWYADLHE